jgi:hypothetical protein
VAGRTGHQRDAGRGGLADIHRDAAMTARTRPHRTAGRLHVRETRAGRDDGDPVPASIRLQRNRVGHPPGPPQGSPLRCHRPAGTPTQPRRGLGVARVDGGPGRGPHPGRTRRELMSWGPRQVARCPDV